MEDLMENEAVQSVGEMLRNARTKQKLTIEDVAAELCIRRFYLNAIENMDFANIPPMPYGLGFVRSYAKFLGLNSDRIVSAYRQMMNGGENPQPQHENNQTKTSAPRLKHIIFGFLGLALLVAAWSVFPTTFRFEYGEEENTISVPEPVIVEEDVETEQALAAVEAESAVETATEENEQPSAEETSDKDAENTEVESTEAVTSLPMKIVLSGPSWLEVRAGDKILISGIYSKGYEYTIPAQKGVLVSVGRPRSVKFFLGEEQVAVASNMKRKNISLDKFFQFEN